MKTISLPALVGALGLSLAAGCAHKPQTASKSDVDGNNKQTGSVMTTKGEVAPPVAAVDPELENLVKKTTITFSFNGSELSEESRARLDKLAQALRKHESVAIQIAGNADERGTEEYNMSLGQDRAEAARRYLSKLGVNETRIRTISYGESAPVDDRQTEDAYSKNRRDDITVEK